MKQTNQLLDPVAAHRLASEIAALVTTIGTSGFYPQLAVFLRQRAHSDSIVMLSYHHGHSPQVLFEDLDPLDREALFGQYFAGAYLLSPFYLQWLESQDKSALLRLQEIAPDGFFDSIYYTDYYGLSGLVDEMGYLIPINSGSAVLVSLGHTARLESYSEREYQCLLAVEPVISASVKVHYSLTLESPAAHFKKQLSDTYVSFGASTLTAQERRVVQMMLRGHSSKSCARELGISPTTERVHRRNIYAKLHISSQAELFIQFFDAIAADTPVSGTAAVTPRSLQLN